MRTKIAGSGVFTAVMALVLLFAPGSCSTGEFVAIVDIFGDEIAGQVKDLIGEEKIARKEAEIAVEHAREEIDELQWLEAESWAKAERLSLVVARLKPQFEETKTLLRRVAERAESGEPILRIDGRAVDTADLLTFVERKKMEAQELAATVQAYEQYIAEYRENAELAHARWTQAQRDVEMMDVQLDMLAIKIERIRLLEQRSGENPALLDESSALSAMDEAKVFLDELTQMLEEQELTFQIHEELLAQQAPVTDADIEALITTSEDVANDIHDFLDSLN